MQVLSFSRGKYIRCYWHHKLWKMVGRVYPCFALNCHFPAPNRPPFPSNSIFLANTFRRRRKVNSPIYGLSKRTAWNSVDFYCDCKWVGFVAVDVQTLFADTLSVLDKFLKMLLLKANYTFSLIDVTLVLE